VSRRLLHGKEKKKGFVGSYAGADGVAPPPFLFLLSPLMPLQSLSRPFSPEQSGVGGFFRGFGWRTGRMCCAMFIMNECKMQLPPLFFPHHFK